MTGCEGCRHVAVLSDVHANATALEAVLAEVERLLPETIVVGGDVVSGPEPAETLERLMGLANTRFVRGNGDREVAEAFDGSGAPVAAEAAWAAKRVDRRGRDFLASFEERVVLPVDRLGDVLFCHGSPRSDEEIVTSLTPELVLGPLLADVEQPVVVCAHTHVQFDRQLGEIRVVNAGSVGMPYEGRRGAFWLLLGPDVELRRTEYDYERAVARAAASGYPEAGNLRDILLHPPDPQEAERYFEQLAAERGERP